MSLHLADAGDSPGVSSSEGEADDQKTVLSLHQLFGDCGHCDAWTPFRSQLDQPARRYACAWGAAVFALFSVLGKKYRYDQVVSVFIYFVTALVFIAPTLFLFSSLKMPSFHVWLWLLLNGFVVNGISYIFWLKALEYGDTSVISNALYFTPFLSLVSITLFLGEQILLSSIVGLIIIVVGIPLQSVNLRQKMPGREERQRGGESWSDLVDQ